MSEELDLSRRIGALTAACEEVELERAQAERPLRASFAEELTPVSEDLRPLEGTLARLTATIRQTELEADAFRRARLFAVWQSARGALAWTVALASAVGLLQAQHGWLALAPLALTAGGSLLGAALSRRRRTP